MRKNLVIRSSVRRIPCWWSWNEHKNTLEHPIKWCGGLRRGVHTRTHKYRAHRDSHQSNKSWEGLFAFFSSSRLVAEPNPFSQQVFDLQNKLTKIYESVHTNEDTTVTGCPTDTRHHGNSTPSRRQNRSQHQLKPLIIINQEIRNKLL